MTIDIALLLLLILAVLVLFVTEKLPVDVTAIGVMVILLLWGVVTPQQGISGFSNPATLTILALFVVSQALSNTGIVKNISTAMLKISGTSYWQVLLVLMLFTAIISAFINTTAVVIVFIPIVLRIAKVKKINPTYLLIPLSFSAMAGGASTVMGTSTNLIVSNIASTHGGTEFGFFEFTVVGIVVLILMIAYFLLFGRKLIPIRKTEGDLTGDYDITNYFTRINVSHDSKLIGQPIKDLTFLSELNIVVIEIIRTDGKIWLPKPGLHIEGGDELLVRSNTENLIYLENISGIKVFSKSNITDVDLNKDDASLIEVIIPKNSFLIGKMVKEIPFLEKYGAIPLALRGSKHLRKLRLRDHQVNFGDSLLLEIKSENKYNFQNNYKNDFIITESHNKTTYKKDKQWIAYTVIISIILLSVFKVFPILINALAGLFILVITKCISIENAYKSIEWRIIFLLAGLIPLGIALENTGASQLIGDGLYSLLNGSPTFVIIGAFFLITTLLSSIVSNNATAILIAPIAISLAAAMSINPLPLLAAVMFGANSSFATPIGYQTNVLIYGPGQYRFADFVRVGLPLTIMVGVAVTFVLTKLYTI